MPTGPGSRIPPMPETINRTPTSVGIARTLRICSRYSACSGVARRRLDRSLAALALFDPFKFLSSTLAESRLAEQAH